MFTTEMADSRLTRRSLLVSLTGAGALAYAPPAVLATDRGVGAPAAPRLFTVALGDLAAGTHHVRVGQPFDLVGVRWRAPRAPRLSLRTLDAAGAPAGAWAHAAGTGHGPDRPAAEDTHVGDPVWTGRSSELQLRAGGAVRDVVLQLVASPGAAGLAAPAALALATPALPAGPGQPPIIARAAWAQGMAPPPRGGAGYGAVRLAFVHHTENPNGYASADVPAMLRAIWAYHVQARGWRDIGYNFVIDAFGRTFEARAGGIDEPVVGAQAGGYNEVSTGVAILGDFSASLPSPAALAALAHLLAWKLSLHGLPTDGAVTVRVNPADAFYTPFAPGAAVTLPRIAGHRDGDSTSCPGDALYAHLPTVRRQALALAGRPLVATLTATATALRGPGTVALRGRLATLAGTPVAGVPVALQSRALAGPAPVPAETTIASLVTGADGSVAFPLALAFNAALRLLFAGGGGLPATVSEPLSLSVSPIVTLVASTAAPPLGGLVTLSGTVSPPAPRVVLTVTGPGGRGRPAVSTHHLLTSGGAFSLTFRPRRAGSYRCVAATAAVAQAAPGTSPPVTLAVA